VKAYQFYNAIKRGVLFKDENLTVTTKRRCRLSIIEPPYHISQSIMFLSPAVLIKKNYLRIQYCYFLKYFLFKNLLKYYFLKKLIFKNIKKLIFNFNKPQMQYQT